MSLSDRVKLVLALPVLVFLSCQDEDLGLDLSITDSRLESLYEELLLPVTNVYIDSLRTDNTTLMLLGDYTDSVYGRTRASAFFTYDSLSIKAALVDTLQYDSAFLIFGLADVRADNSLSNQQFAVYELADTIFDQGVYFRDSSIPLGEALDTFSIDISPIDSVLKIPVDNLGFHFTSTNILGKTDTTRYSYGIVPIDPVEALFTIQIQNDTTGIYIYSSGSDDTVYETIYLLRDEHFTQVERDRTGSKIASAVNDLDEFDGGNGLTYLNPLSGAYIALDLAPLQDFLIANPDVIIQKAEFEFELYDPDAFDPIDPVNAIQFFNREDNGGFDGSNLFNPSGSMILTDNGYLSNSGAILRVPYDDDEKKYIGNITMFTEVLLDNVSNDEEFLMDAVIMTGVNFLIQEQSALPTNGFRVNIFYTDVK